MIKQIGVKNPQYRLTLEEIIGKYPPTKESFNFIDPQTHNPRSIVAEVSRDENGVLRYVKPRTTREVTPSPPSK